MMIQIRDAPETLHRQFQSRAALAGMSRSGYLLDEIRRMASQRSSVDSAVPPAEAVRAERDRL